MAAGRPARSPRSHREALRLCRAVSAGDEVTAYTQHILGHVLLDQAEYATALATLGDSRALYQGLADDNSVAILTSDLGMVAFHVGDLSSAERSFKEALDIFRGLANAGYTADTLARLGDVARTQGDPEQARARYEESLAIARSLGMKPELAKALHRSAYLSLREGDVTEARARLRAIAGQRATTSFGHPVAPRSLVGAGPARVIASRRSSSTTGGRS